MAMKWGRPGGSEGSGTIEFEHLGIAEALHRHRFVVPPNQRDYAWQDEHVTELFQDLSRAIEGNPASYFLGTIVLTTGSGSAPEVSDGQQRLATTSILLAAMRDHLLISGDQTRAQSIEQDYLNTIALATTELSPKLKLNTDDDEFFRHRVLAHPGTTERGVEPTRDSHRRLKRAAELANEQVAKIIALHKPSEQALALVRWVEFLRDGAQVILLTVPNHLNAFAMFETLNDRGLRASEADLLKNYLLSKAGARMDEARQRWARMLGVLESISSQDITVTYLRHLLITQAGPTKERDIYQRVETKVSGPSQALAFATTLAESAQTYAALFQADNPKWNDYDDSVRRDLETMLELGVEQIRPLMFAVALKFSPAELQSAFRLFVSWSVRFLIVGGRGGLLDRNYSVVAEKVGTGQITTAKALAAAMADALPPDAEFRDSFTVARVSQTRLARYYLRALEAEKRRSAGSEVEPVKDKLVLNLEHILPETPGNNWPDVATDVAEAFYRRLGNMVLLHAKKNSRIGNSSFSDKQHVLAESPLLLTCEVANENSWGKTEIERRQVRLADLAVRAWPLTV